MFAAMSGGGGTDEVDGNMGAFVQRILSLSWRATGVSEVGKMLLEVDAGGGTEFF